MKCTHCSLCYRVQAPLFVVQPKRTFHCHTDRAHLSLSYRLSTPFTVIPTERAFHCHTDRAQRVECIFPQSFQNELQAKGIFITPINKKRTLQKGAFLLAQRRGFEPPVRFRRTHDFQSCSLNHSDISAFSIWL